jgi:hypothetical protein
MVGSSLGVYGRYSLESRGGGGPLQTRSAGGDYLSSVGVSSCWTASALNHFYEANAKRKPVRHWLRRARNVSRVAIRWSRINLWLPKPRFCAAIAKRKPVRDRLRRAKNLTENRVEGCGLVVGEVRTSPTRN